ncbi:MAG TPA: TlpA disulfide reductase family protein [Puia sp.]|nr:TlpA disulfide reductase family protein [Puia sp.]
MFKKFLVLASSAMLLLIISCKHAAKNSFQVNVSFANADKLSAFTDVKSIKVYLEEISFGKDQPPVALDSARLPGNNGKISLKGIGRPQGIYELVFGENMQPIPLINDAEQIKLNVDFSKDDYYQVDGSEASKQLKDLITTFGKKNYEIEQSSADLDSLKISTAPDSQSLASAALARNQAIDDLNNYLKHFISTTSNATLGVLALSWASRSLPSSDFEASLNGLQKKFPDNIALKSMAGSFRAQQQEQAAAEQKLSDNSWVGKEAPDFSLPDINGKKISLSSFRGKYVLVDFWASWCRPCRAENPNVVEAYNRFKNKNFTILGVSLDKEKDAWKQAIKDDKLAWTQVSDLKYWNSEVVNTFKIDGIPFNILVDPEGKIIGQELRGPDLENKLQEALK